jgi:hypothetical protein
METTFNNIYSAISFREKCPFCNKRNKLYLAISNGKINDDYNKLYDLITGNNLNVGNVNINLITNEIYNENNINSIFIRSLCKKYHYAHLIKISMENKIISKIELLEESFSIFRNGNYYNIVNKINNKCSLHTNFLSTSRVLETHRIELDTKKNLLDKIDKILLLA